MASEGAIRRKLTVKFNDGNEETYLDEAHVFCFDSQALFIKNRYTTEIELIYPYHTIKKVQQETIR